MSTPGNGGKSKELSKKPSEKPEKHEKKQRFRVRNFSTYVEKFRKLRRWVACLDGGGYWLH